MNQTKKDKRIPVLGGLLILVGLVLLLDQLQILHLGFWTVVAGFMIGYGALQVIRSFSGANRNRVFWGTFLFLAGLYIMFDHLNLIAMSGPAIVPVLFLILGFAFLMSYIYRPSDWHLLIPALFFLLLGGIIVGEDLGYLRDVDLPYYLSNYWPVVLIFFGIALVLKSRKRITTSS